MLLKKFPAFYETRKFITIFIRARHMSRQIDPVHVSPSNLSKIHFNITVPSTPGSSKWSPSLRFYSTYLKAKLRGGGDKKETCNTVPCCDVLVLFLTQQEYVAVTTVYLKIDSGHTQLSENIWHMTSPST
jgi:hypothetical protein